MMSEAATATRPTARSNVSEQPEQSSPAALGRMAELRVSAHLMTLEAGLFCIFHMPVGPQDGSGLPGIRISRPPSAAGRPDAVNIATFRDDGWLQGGDDAALVRVTAATAQILVTIYQAPGQAPESAPRMQVVRLSPDVVGANGAASQPVMAAPGATPASGTEVVAHIQRAGDVGARIGEWIGKAGSQQWIEGFSIQPQAGIKPEDIEYQAVLGRGWLSPWSDGGKFCGSRGMALPLLGLRLRLRDEAAAQFDCAVSATFVDGSSVGPVPAGESCEAESLAALESFRIVLTPKGAARGTRVPQAAEPAPPPRAKRPPAAKPAPKPAPGRRGR